MYHYLIYKFSQRHFFIFGTQVYLCCFNSRFYLFQCTSTDLNSSFLFEFLFHRLLAKFNLNHLIHAFHFCCPRKFPIEFNINTHIIKCIQQRQKRIFIESNKRKNTQGLYIFRVPTYFESQQCSGQRRCLCFYESVILILPSRACYIIQTDICAAENARSVSPMVTYDRGRKLKLFSAMSKHCWLMDASKKVQTVHEIFRLQVDQQVNNMQWSICLI